MRKRKEKIIIMGKKKTTAQNPRMAFSRKESGVKDGAKY